MASLLTLTYVGEFAEYTVQYWSEGASNFRIKDDVFPHAYHLNKDEVDALPLTAKQFYSDFQTWCNSCKFKPANISSESSIEFLDRTQLRGVLHANPTAESEIRFEGFVK